MTASYPVNCIDDEKNVIKSVRIRCHSASHGEDTEAIPVWTSTERRVSVDLIFVKRIWKTSLQVLYWISFSKENTIPRYFACQDRRGKGLHQRDPASWTSKWEALLKLTAPTLQP